uniref:Uncharacterized protein n=1 Tax=Romanomermis culicivorax TaxID=13658 RepID=A0A915I510_ROMCU
MDGRVRPAIMTVATTKRVYGGGGGKDKEQCKWGRVVVEQTVVLLCGLSIRCTCAGETSTNKAQKRLEKKKQPVLGEVTKQNKEKEKNEITVQKLHVNGGDIGENRRQSEVVVDNRSDCNGFGGGSHYDSREGHEDHRVHQNEPNGRCDCDRDRCCRGG